jgi:hypothetical protein
MCATVILSNRDTMMKTRRAQYTEEATDIERTRLDKYKLQSLESIKKKFLENHLKIETIIEECTHLDVKNDQTVHPDDLIDIINSLLPAQTITRREFHYLIMGLNETIGSTSGQSIPYLKLYEIFPDSKKKKQREEEKEREEAEQWFDERVDEFADYDSQHGSIGEWLHRKACPSEIENYKTLISCLEIFERESGLRITAQPNGFDIPLGPDLRAKLKFYIR